MFFEEIFGNCRGYLCIHVISGGNHSEEFFSYPEEVPIAQELIRGNATKKGVNIYFYPVLFKSENSGLKVDGESNVAFAPVVSADLNMTSPVLVTPTPDLITESSRGRYQAYWLRADATTVITPLSVDGIVQCDFKLRRVPSTYNWKYHGEAWKIKIIDPSQLNTCDKVRKRYDLYGEQFEQLFRSTDRWSLARICGRLGATVQEVFLVLWGSQLLHSGTDALSYARTTLDGNDATVSIGTLYRESVNAVAACKVPSLLSDDELRSRGTTPSGFVERYVSWASSCTDSPLQYHVAGALTILSSLLCPHLRLDTSFGAFRPNLWFMILAGTTTTRKSTSMRLAVRLLEDVHDDPILATDGTPEGIISELSDRDGKSSLFYRDEITGLIEAMTRKDYLAGMMEALTKLYDGEKEKRTLRRQTITVTDPNLVILSGGIRNKMAEILDAKHIGSGFLPRFLVVSGWTGVEDMKPIGPPEETVSDIRDSLVVELTRLYKHFSKRPAVHEIDGSNVFAASSSKARIVHLGATDPAWNRIRRLESDVRDMGLSSENPDIFGPIYERMMNSIIKVAMLIAADRYVKELGDSDGPGLHTDDSDGGVCTSGDSVGRLAGKATKGTKGTKVPASISGKDRPVGPKVIITLDDIVTAISYADIWIESVYEIAANIDDKPTEDERKVEAIEKFIVQSDREIPRSDLMRRFRLRASQMNEIEATLIQRGAVIATKIEGKKTLYRPSIQDVV
jgi:hypothetical protein